MSNKSLNKKGKNLLSKISLYNRENSRFFIYLIDKFFRCIGLQPEDLIVALNGQDVTHLTHDQLVGKLKGFSVGDDVMMTVKRHAEPSPSSIASRTG